jgi:hypothetical protein
MAQTPTQRTAAHRARKIAAGGRQKVFLLTAEECDVLARKAKAEGVSETQLVKRWLAPPKPAPAPAPKAKPSTLSPGSLVSLPPGARLRS